MSSTQTMISIEQRYRRANGLLPHRTPSLVFRSHVAPRWSEGEDAFSYRVRTREGEELVRVDPVARTRTVVDDAPPADAAAPEPGEPGETRSPDGRHAVFVRDDDLWVRDVAGGGERRLTRDGGEGIVYGRPIDIGRMPLTLRQLGLVDQAQVSFSPDGARILACRFDQRELPELTLTEAAAPDRGGLPHVHRLRYPVLGGPLPTATLHVFELATGRHVPVAIEPFEVQFLSPLDLQRHWWSRDGATVWALEVTRGASALRLHAIDAASGAARLLVQERGDTVVEAGPIPFLCPPVIRVLEQRGELLWWSERDGWGHLWVLDLETGAVRRQLTSGDWQVREILHVDEREGVVFLAAGGREAGRNPYDRYAYRVPLDGGEPRLLTPEDGDHDVRVAPSGRWLVDTWSCPQDGPVSVLRDAGGELLLELERADLELLRDAGWSPPERFTVKAADGVTDLHGLLFAPADMEPGEPYPVLDSNYPGPQTGRLVRGRFGPMNLDPFLLDPLGRAPAMAQLGFGVMLLDARGTPLRSKALRDASYGRLEKAGFLEDHVAALEQLARTRPWMDLERVGIYGHSGGGYAAARALADHGDTYSVAVSSAGTHDLRGYYAVWGETYQGPVEEGRYEAQATASAVERLRGKLLLVCGELDDNVHPGMSIGLAKTLVAANKDFDFLLLPGAGHMLLSAEPYYVRRLWDYFVAHLHGVQPPAEFAVDPGCGELTASYG